MIVYAWVFRKGKRELNVRVEGQLVFNSPIQILNATLAGLGLAFTLEDRVREHIAQGRLKRVLDDWRPTFAGYHLYYPSRRRSSPVFSLLVDALRYQT